MRMPCVEDGSVFSPQHCSELLSIPNNMPDDIDFQNEFLPPMTAVSTTFERLGNDAQSNSGASNGGICNCAVLK